MTNNVNGKVKWIHGIIDRLLEKKEPVILPGTTPKLEIVGDLNIIHEEPIGYGNNRQAVVYIRNFGIYQRIEIIPISWLGREIPPQYDKQIPVIEEGITSLFLCKQARKDVEAGLKGQKMDPWKYITRASTSKRGEIQPFQMKQGIVYCTHIEKATQAYYARFFNSGRMG